MGRLCKVNLDTNTHSHKRHRHILGGHDMAYTLRSTSRHALQVLSKLPCAHRSTRRHCRRNELGDGGPGVISGFQWTVLLAA